MSHTKKSDDNWLDKWSPQLKEKRVLELGCGQGLDTLIIAKEARSVVACDTNPVLSTDDRVSVLALDHSKSLPFRSDKFDVVIASLCLHYFCWHKTEDIVREISRVLTNEGLLICRLNSEEDVNYGATGYPEIESGLYDVSGSSKRFFSKNDVLKLFSSHWLICELQHKSIDRYQHPKFVWELGAFSV